MDGVVADPQKKKKASPTDQAEALEAESPKEDATPADKAEDSSVKEMGKAANQGSQTTGAPISKNDKGGSTLAGTTAAAPKSLPEHKAGELGAAAAANAKPKAAPRTFDEMDEKEVDALVKAGNLGAVGYRNKHPKKPVPPS